MNENKRGRAIWRLGVLIVISIVLGSVMLMALREPELYPFRWLAQRMGGGPELVVDAGQIPSQAQALEPDEEPVVNPNARWKVNFVYRLSACDNRPGLKKIYVRVLDEEGEGLGGIKARFAAEYGKGIAFDIPNVMGWTDERGFLEWDHFGVPTRYMFYMEDDEVPLIEHIRTDLGYEYCSPAPWPPQGWYGGWRPINKPGVYSYRAEVQLKEH